MSMTDQDDNKLLEPSHQSEKLAYEDVWAAYKFQRGFHDGERVTGYMTLDSAREEARKRNEQMGDREDYSFVVYRPYRHTRRRRPHKPGPRKR